MKRVFVQKVPNSVTESQHSTDIVWANPGSDTLTNTFTLGPRIIPSMSTSEVGGRGGGRGGEGEGER